MKNPFKYILLFAFALCSLAASSQTDTPITQQNHLQEFEKLIGTWHVPDSVAKKIPELKGKAVFKFEFDNAKSHLIMYEDVSLNDSDIYTFKGIVMLNPITMKYEFFGVNAKKGYLFKGFYTNVTEKGFTREYDVYYPEDDQIAQAIGQVVSFREDFMFRNNDEMSFSIKYYNPKTKKWEMWSQNEFVVIKKASKRL